MACYKPLTGWYSRNRNPSGKFSIVFDKSKANRLFANELKISCGQCIGCRLERSRQWAVRCVHEASLHETNCFLTLTFNNENLDKDGSLRKRDFQLFLKRLRRWIDRENLKGANYGKIRFFHCGEYGERFKRPHHHAIIFNFNFPDRTLFSNHLGNKLYRSQILNDIWGFGECRIGEVTFESCAYVARYITKKVTGEQSENHYSIINFDTGEITKREPEYVTMSRGGRQPDGAVKLGGIGKLWFDKYYHDVYKDCSDFVLIRGKKMRPPKYYDKQFEILYPDDFKKLKYKRVENGKKFSDNNTPERLLVREQLQIIRSEKLIRSFENDG